MVSWATAAKAAVLTQPLAIVGLFYERTGSLTRAALDGNPVSLSIAALLAATTILAALIMVCDMVRGQRRFVHYVPRLVFVSAGCVATLALIIVGASLEFAPPTLVVDYFVYAALIATAGLLIEKDLKGRV